MGLFLVCNGLFINFNYIFLQVQIHFLKLHMKVDISAGLMYEFGKNSLHSLSNKPLQFSMLVQSNE